MLLGCAHLQLTYPVVLVSNSRKTALELCAQSILRSLVNETKSAKRELQCRLLLQKQDSFRYGHSRDKRQAS